MASNNDDAVVSCDSEGTFSGFSPVRDSENSDDDVVRYKGKRHSKQSTKSSAKQKDAPKEKVSKENSKKSKKTATKTSKDSSQAHTSRDAVPNFDITKLSEADIQNLRNLLGINMNTADDSQDEFESQETSGTPLSKLPRLTVEIDSADISGGESPARADNRTKNTDRNILSDMTNALFEDGEIVDDNEWDLPRLKAPVKGKAVTQSLANMINTACTTQCETETLLSKYKVPENCEKACAPLVNNEIWKVMDKRSQTSDRSIADIQNLVVTGMVPIIKLADILKPQISSNPEAKSLLADSLTLLGQVQYNLSIRRRYMIRPTLKKKYHSLCNISMPISSNLFGDEVSKDIKACDSLIGIGRDQYNYRGSSYRGRGNPRFQRRGNYGYNNSSGNRYQPYQSNRGQNRGSKNYKIPKKSQTATVTSPNE